MGRGDCTKRAFLCSPLSPINLELTKAGREVAESSLVPPLPQRGCPQLWEGLPPLLLLLPPLLLLPLPLDKPHQYLAWWVQGSPSAGRLWLGGISRDRRGGPPQMGLHVAGQLGRGLAVHAAQLAQDAVSPRGLEPMVLHRVDAQVCCCGEAFVAELTDMVRALAVHLHVVRNIS